MNFVLFTGLIAFACGRAFSYVQPAGIDDDTEGAISLSHLNLPVGSVENNILDIFAPLGISSLLSLETPVHFHATHAIGWVY